MAGSSDEGSAEKDFCHPPPRTDGRIVIPKMPTFTYFDAGFMLVSMATFLVDVGTDLNLVIHYVLSGSMIWAGLTLALVIVPAIIVMILSMRWFYAEAEELNLETSVSEEKESEVKDSSIENGSENRSTVSKICWLAHVCLWGILYRYIHLFKAGLKAQKTKDLSDFESLHRQQSDVCMLRLFESFLESAPQLVLQLYIMMSHHDYSAWTTLTAFSSMASLGWGIAAYTKAMRNTLPAKHKMTISGLVLQTLWRWGMIAARVAALALVATVLNEWILVIMGAHLVVMFLWVVKQKAEFSKSTVEEIVFNLIMAVTYCFCFFNLKEGKSRWRMLAFYCIIVAENIAFVLYYYFMSEHKPFLKLAGLVFVHGAMVLGLLCMVLYYRFFHPIGPIKLQISKKEKPVDIEDGKKDTEGTPTFDSNANSSLRHSGRRNIKYLYAWSQKNAKCILSAPGISLESSPSSATSQESPKPLCYMQRPVEMMCSVQDLLANVSCPANEMEVAEAEEGQIKDATETKTEHQVVGEASPSSLERTVTRELEFRLSQSEFKTFGGLGEQSQDEKEASVLPQLPQQQSKTSVTSSATFSESLHSSPNCVGIPPKSKTSQTSIRSVLSGSQHSGSSILRTSIRKKGATTSDTDVRLNSLPHITSSTINITSKSQEVELEDNEAQLSKPHIPNVELAVIDRMHIIEMESSGTSSENQSDYENIYEGQDPRRNLPPKPSHLIVQNLDDTQTTQSSVPHDYENLCAVNINRAMLGVRHWKTYSDIEDRIHDDSTFKERLKLLDSTLMSSFHSDYSTIRGIQALKSLSMVDDSESVLSRSLPDLSTLRLETCLEEAEEDLKEEPLENEDKKEMETKDETICDDVKDDSRLMAVLNQLRANRPLNKSNSVDNIPNYETIWVGDIEKPDTSNASSQLNSLSSKSSLVVTIGDVRAKESLCNLYYSTMSDLSFRYYSERMKKNSSSGSLASKRSTRDTSREMMRAISVPDNKTLLEVSQLIEEQKKRKEEEEQALQQGNAVAATPCRPQTSKFGPGATPVKSDPCNNRPRRKFSMLRERFENPNWTPLRSPMKRRPSTQRRNSFQDRTAKALQAGMKVFRRPRVHVITPKKGEDKMETPRLKSPFKSRNVTPSNTLAARVMPDPSSTGTALKTRLLENEYRMSVHKTPQLKTAPENMLSKRTPKTSTPENKQALVKKTPVGLNSKKAKTLTEGPKTSTPEGNKQLPQISILSAVSSVVPSPESVLKFNISDQQQRIPLSENMHQMRTSTKSLAMPVIKETEFLPSVLFPKPFYGSVQSTVPQTASHTIKSKIISDENNQEIQKCPSGSGLIPASSVLSVKSKTGTPLGECGNRLAQGQPMFSGTLGLPPYQQDSCRPAVVNVAESPDNLQNQQQNVSVSRIVLSSPQSPGFNMQKSTLSPNSKIFSRRI